MMKADQWKKPASKSRAGQPKDKRGASRKVLTKTEKKIPRTRKPAGMTLEQWQRGLRAQFGRDQNFGLKNIGDHAIFSEFLVSNPETGGNYKVAVRGREPGDNFCSCPDFAVNTLGTCKHIEFVISKLEKRRGAKKAFAAGFHPVYSEVFLRYGVRREVVFRAGTECPKTLLDLAKRYFDDKGLLIPTAYARFDAFLKQAGKVECDLRCYDDAIGFIARARDQAMRRVILDQAFPQGADSPAFDACVKTSLYPYQRYGALFAARAGRCLIADDMGLGKTVQAIAAAQILADVVGVERVLVVSPTSLKHQWAQEIARFTDRSAVVIEGLLARRAELYRENSFYKIVNYDVIHRDMEPIRRWAPDLIILDEAQRIKNWKTRTAKSVKKLSSEYAIVLTGTPLENRLEELHSIVEFVDRFRLGPMFQFLSEHQHADEGGKVIGYRNLGAVAKTLAPILVRRNKREVLKELPERIEKSFFLPMTPQQQNHHDENRDIVGQIVSKWRRYHFLSETDQRRLMIALQNMRMACDSSYLLDQSTEFGVKADEVCLFCEEALENPDVKIVVFSQWLRMHELLVNRLKRGKWEPVLFHGGVPGSKRKDLIRRFKEDPDLRIFLSTDAGGVGLNLQNASMVVNVEQPWNPAVLEQRIGRVHRMGQKRPVHVAHFISQGTIEHGMLSLLSFKKSMFAGVLDGGRDEVFLGGTKLKRFMDTVQTATGAMTGSMPSSDDDAPPDPQSGQEELFANEPAASEQTPDWSDLLTSGLAFINQLGRAIQAGQGSDRSPAPDSAGSPFVVRDEKTGQSYLKLPTPDPELLLKAADWLTAMAGGKRKT